MKILGKNNMNIYDFDKTIYKNDSSIDFYKFCIKKNRKVLLILPKFFIYIVLYSIKIIEKERLKSCFFSFVKYFNDIESVAYKFWEEKESNKENIDNNFSQSAKDLKFDHNRINSISTFSSDLFEN